jgi:putative glutamine amidotransferase
MDSAATAKLAVMLVLAFTPSREWYSEAMSSLIGITAGEIYNKDHPWSPVTYGQSRTYTEAIIGVHGVPLILPITTRKTTLRAMYESVGGLLLAGGNDPNPRLYGEEPHPTTKGNVSRRRDSFEKQLIIWALQDSKPILAICRGMQLLNIVCGGNLYQDIPAYFPHAEDHTGSNVAKDIEHLAHTLRLKQASRLTAILGVATIKTNSSHHQAIKLLAPNLQAVAWSDDGIIEAVEGKTDAYIIGVQSHPESLVAKAEKTWLKLFESFVQAATK